MFGNLFNVEKLTYDTIQETLLNVCEELECSYSDVFIRIKPTNEECDMEFHVMQVVEGRACQ
jgi:hypothetical protein